MATPASSRTSTLVLLFVAAPIVLLLSIALTLAAWIGSAFSSDSSAAEEVAQYAALWVLGVAPAVALIVAGVRANRAEASALARTAMAVGVVIAIVAVMTSGQLLARSTCELVRVAVLQAAPVTAEESEFTPAQLRGVAEQFVADTAASLGETTRPDDGSSIRDDPCRLGNLDPGVEVTTLGELFLTGLDGDAALEAIRAQWESRGYTVHDGSPGTIWMDAAGALASASAHWVPDNNREVVDYNIDILFTTRCVAE